MQQNFAFRGVDYGIHLNQQDQYAHLNPGGLCWISQRKSEIDILQIRIFEVRYATKEPQNSGQY